LNMGLTQALSDGTNTYIYGNGRIAQTNVTSTDYFLGDALGSVRQLTNQTGAITYARAYDPYGVATQTSGASQTAYGYTGEFTSNNMVYLRSRMYSPNTGRFLTRDTWQGDSNSPMSYNVWLYVEGNPINATDPSGYITEKESKRADLILDKLNSIYSVQIKKDWGYLNELINTDNIYINSSMGCTWMNGNWRSRHELELTLQAVKDMTKAFGPQKGLFNTAMRWQPVRIYRLSSDFVYDPNKHGAYSINNLILPNNVFDSSDAWAKGQIVHELAHVIDYRQWWPPFRLSNGMAALTQSFKDGVYNPAGQNEPPPTGYAQGNPREDWAESFKFFVYPSFGTLGSIRKGYIQSFIRDMKSP